MEDERLLFVARRLEGEAMTDRCRELGISRKTGHELIARYRDCGAAALADRPRTPGRVASRLAPAVERMIVDLRREKPHWGARKLRELMIRRLGRDSIAMLLADREFVGEDCFNWLDRNDIPFTIRLAQNRLVNRADGCRVRFSSQITHHKRGHRCTATLDGIARPLHFAAVKPKCDDWIIAVSNRSGHDPRTTYRKRRAIKSLFGNTKTHGLNFEDTRLTDPAKLHRLTALAALAGAWSVRAARTRLGNTAPPRKTHGYLARSYFRTGFTFLRNRLRSNHPETLAEWINLPKTLKKQGVV